MIRSCTKSLNNFYGPYNKPAPIVNRCLDGDRKFAQQFGGRMNIIMSCENLLFFSLMLLILNATLRPDVAVLFSNPYRNISHRAQFIVKYRATTKGINLRHKAKPTIEFFALRILDLPHNSSPHSLLVSSSQIRDLRSLYHYQLELSTPSIH